MSLNTRRSFSTFVVVLALVFSTMGMAIAQTVEFTDISGNVHETSILQMAEQGVTSGYPDGTFRPANLVTRGQMATLIFNAVDLPAPPPSEVTCVDINTADVELLQEIVHIGPDRAQEMVTIRPFASVNDMGRITGIGDARLLDIINEGIAATSCAADGFSDVAGSAHRASIEAMAAHDIINGYADGTFRPNNPITRGQMATLLANAFNLDASSDSPFSDVAGTTHAAGINAIAAAEVTSGYPDGTFRPQANTPRDQTATFLANTLDGDGVTTGWTVTNIVDGDTVDVTSTSGTVERIRIIGIDTPERGECGFAEATAAMAALVDGEQVTLVAGARDDRDRYGRLLRYIDVGTIDAGLTLIEQGWAIARYDSRDGYGAHPREAAYVAADAAADNYTCAA